MVHLKRPIEMNELGEKLMVEEDPRVKGRLPALIHLYEGKDVRGVSTIAKRSINTVERWIRAWSKNGYEGLLPKFTGGPKRLSDDGWDKTVKEIEDKGMTVRDVVAYVKDKRGVNYKYSGVWEAPRRRKRHAPYGEGCRMNSKRPSNAEEILKKGSGNHFTGQG